MATSKNFNLTQRRYHWQGQYSIQPILGWRTILLQDIVVENTMYGVASTTTQQDHRPCRLLTL
ncbi:protein of unknown function [Acidithiobacillus ferrivorans]|uniref:Uncharacterized protein n=1 Tax=Acidithiobacillus ferrivorans TaxID=160808 RepID=A0A060USR6_9PROT|nr:hypothetical protein AFERRI_310001 [Acidithiobacillus ferrivorans]SMH66286.1 protein of unknown function [Acidithiobacillus ferrivorans]